MKTAAGIGVAMLAVTGWFCQRQNLLLTCNAAFIAMLCFSITGYIALRWKMPYRLIFAAVIFADLAVVQTIFINGSSALFWVFPILLLNFYIVTLRAAIMLNAALMAVSSTLAWHVADMDTAVRFTVSGCIVFALYMNHVLDMKAHHDILYSRVHTDTLTGVGNRAALQAAMEQAIALSVRYATPVSVIMVDADRFKQINDLHGHARGDQVLRALAGLLRSRLRETDGLYRYGGEEFVIILPHTVLKEAQTLAHDLRELVQGGRFAGVEGLTVSCGVAQYSPGETPESLFGRVDRAMYAAKNSGRNQVVVCDASSAARAPEADVTFSGIS